AGQGDYRAGDTIWLERVAPDAFGHALNRDVLVPRPAGRFLFGRLIGREPGRLQVLPLAGGGRQQVLADPPWLGVATRLVRPIGGGPATHRSIWRECRAMLREHRLQWRE